MDIIERAARAYSLHLEFDPDVIVHGGPRWEHYVPTVRAVLSAIREPSVAMKGAAMDAGFGPDVATRAYQAMIDAALIEGE